MKSKLNRRNFLKRSSQAGMACCALLMSPDLLAAAMLNEDEKIDPKKLNYCGYTCPKDCLFYVATIENDPEKKKQAYNDWKIKERYGLDFDEKTAFCWRCKAKDKPLGVAAKNCTVRSCAVEMGFDSCIQCDQLTSCDKDLWTRFPEFYKSVKKMQVKYLEQIA